MIGRKEEERNEKIIRGLMKLPPNRRCINCNSLGPQYVCTNFWTFVCTTCSGIHREFTHRVKSVSMAKFTTQEVEALQRGGNQRAREIFLEGWDIQNQRLPNSSNVDKIREFIKAVYVEKKYERGTSSNKPPRDVQNNRNFEEDRRASSYHSYSQSPPYDHQYEDRRYGKQSGILTRRTGSDRLHYDGKLAGIAYSPGHMGEHTYGDRFASDGSGPRYSDYSVSSAGETLRYDVQSPNFQKDSGYSSPSQPGRNNLIEDDNVMRDVHKNPHTRKTTSLSSFESGNPLPSRSVKSASLVDVKFASEQHSVTQLTESSVPPSLPQSTGQTHAVKQDLFSLLSVNSVQPSTSSAPQFIDLFAEINQPPSTTSSDHKPEQIPFTKNEGWATFDLLQPAGSSFEPKNAASNIPPMDEISKVNFDSFSSETNSSHWPSAQTYAGQQRVGSVNDQWNLASHEASQSLVLSSSEFWNAFDDSTGNSAQTSTGSSSSETNAQVPADRSHLFVDSYVGLKPPEASSKYDFQRITVDSGFPVHSVSFGDGIIGPTNPLAVFPNMGKKAHERKSVNPFDFPCEPELGSGNALDMSSLHAALPNPQFHATFPNNKSQPFFPQNPLPPYISTAPSGGFSYMAGQPPNSHLPNLSSQSHVASLGGNPFA